MGLDDYCYFCLTGFNFNLLFTLVNLALKPLCYTSLMELTTPVQKVYMVGPTYAKRLEKLGIKTVEDLLFHFPNRYEDYSLIAKINRLKPGETVTIRGTVTEIKNEYTKNGKKIQKALVSDNTKILEVTWFNQPFLTRTIKVGETYNFSGKVNWFGHKLSLISPEYEQILGQRYEAFGSIHTGRLVPVYAETYGVSSKWLRSRIAPLLKENASSFPEYLPEKIIRENQLLNYQKAINQIHFPDNQSLAEEAKKRLAFDELFLIQLVSLKRKKDGEQEHVKHQFKIDLYQPAINNLINKLPFNLTGAQQKAMQEILHDLAQSKPMNRLLEGDVGSGKTVVAAISMYLSYLNGFQSLLLSPTEILANQHFKTLKTLLEPFGVKVSLRTGTFKKEEEFDVIVGTHALLSKKVKIAKLGLVVVDEQHRFGVEQRTEIQKKGFNPHLLSMTATPIPRTVALTLYGDLDLSFLDEMPQGRMKVKTWVVPSLKREAAYAWIKKRVKGTKEQAFIICPLIEESETLVSVRAATQEFENLQKKIFPDLRLGLLHGRMKAKDKDAEIERFRSGKLDILVSTPVVEVGIDIPQATIMMIEGAERFGLAQLHQLRGRVGRADLTSYCLLFSESQDSQRLKAMEKIHIGANLAELDLQMRGPGEILGTKQHGIPDLKVASLTDKLLLAQTRLAAQETIDEDLSLKKFPLLKEKLERLTIKAVSSD